MPDQKDNYFCFISLSASLYRLCENPSGWADFLVPEHAWRKEELSKASAINASLSSDPLTDSCIQEQERQTQRDLEI